MVRTRVGVIARVLAIAGLLAVNAVVGVRTDSNCWNCPVGGLCMQLYQGDGNTQCQPLGDTCSFFGDSCTVNP